MPAGTPARRLIRLRGPFAHLRQWNDALHELGERSCALRRLEVDAMPLAPQRREADLVAEATTHRPNNSEARVEGAIVLPHRRDDVFQEAVAPLVHGPPYTWSVEPVAVRARLGPPLVGT